MTQAPTIDVRGTQFMDGVRLFGHIDVHLPAGQWTCVLGRSGVGKSTLLRLIAGLTLAGEFDGDITASDGIALANRISVMAQSDLLLPWLSVLENTVLGARLRGQVPDFDRAENINLSELLKTSQDKTNSLESQLQAKGEELNKLNNELEVRQLTYCSSPSVN